MAYYDEHGGDGAGRFTKNFDGPVGPRRPSMYMMMLLRVLFRCVCDTALLSFGVY